MNIPLWLEIGAGVPLVGLAAFRAVYRAAPFFGEWTYDLEDDALAVRVLVLGRFRLRPRFVPYASVTDVRRFPGRVPPPGGLPGVKFGVKLGRRRLLGIIGSKDGVELLRTGWTRPVLITPPAPDRFRKQVLAKLASVRETKP